MIGFIGALLIAGLGYIHDEVMGLGRLVGNFLPVGVFGLVVVMALAVNPLLFVLRRRWRLRPAELAVGVALMLVACTIPGGLMHLFVPTLALPAQLNEEMPGWRKYDLIGYVSPAMLPSGGRYDEHAGSDVRSGARRAGHNIGLGDVPWAEWQTSLVTWMTIIVLGGVAVIALSLVVHRQWSSHERLRYPIAQVAHSLMDQDPNRPIGGVFRNRYFICGMMVILTIQVINGIHAWYPNFIRIPMEWDVMYVGQVWPVVWKVPLTWRLLSPRLYPSIIAFAFFLASDVSLSLGIAHWVFLFLAATLITHGVDTSQDLMTGKPMGWQIFGSYLGLALLVAYTGRRYYRDVLRRAFFGGAGRAESQAPPSAVWGCRVFLLSAAALASVLVVIGLEWPLAILTVLLLMMMYLGMARITAESGLFFLQSYWLPTGILIGLFGQDVLGPQAIIVSGLVCTILAGNSKECLMPFVVNGLKICDGFRVKLSRIGLGAVIVFVLALAVAIPVVLWANYNFGLPRVDRTGQSGARRPFEAAQPVAGKLMLYGELDKVDNMGALRRVMSIRPEPKFLAAAGVGLGLMLVFSALRLRFAWWPFHPFMFLVWGTWAMAYFGPSFLLGWFIKMVVTKLGGGRKYEQLKPFMIGVVAGDLLGALIFLAVGIVYYFATGRFPVGYKIYP